MTQRVVEIKTRLVSESDATVMLGVNTPGYSTCLIMMMPHSTTWQCRTAPGSAVHHRVALDPV